MVDEGSTLQDTSQIYSIKLNQHASLQLRKQLKQAKVFR